MYLCIYIVTHLHTVYLNWLQAVFESNSRGDWTWWLSEHRDTLRGIDPARLEVHLAATIARTWGPWSSESRDTLGGRNRVSLGMHLVTMIEWVWRYTPGPWWSDLGGRNWVCLELNMEAVFERVWRITWRRWTSEIGHVLGCGWRTARQMLWHNWSVWQLATVGMWRGDILFELPWRAGWWRSIV